MVGCPPRNSACRHRNYVAFAVSFLAASCSSSVSTSEAAIWIYLQIQMSGYYMRWIAKRHCVGLCLCSGKQAYVIFHLRIPRYWHPMRGGKYMHIHNKESQPYLTTDPWNSSGVYICNSIVNDLRHGNYIPLIKQFLIDACICPFDQHKYLMSTWNVLIVIILIQGEYQLRVPLGIHDIYIR